MQDLKIKMQFIPELQIDKINVLLRALKQSMGQLGKDIQLLDTNKIKAEMSEIDRAMNKTNTGMKGAASSSKQFADNVGRAAQQGSALGKAFAFNQIAQSMQLITSSLNQFTQPFVELDKQVQNIGTLGRENFQEFADLATELSISVPDDASTIAQGVYQAISAGMKGTNQELIEFVEIASKAGVAGLSDTASAVDGLTSVMNAYKLPVSEAQAVSDTFFGGIKLGKTTFEELNSSISTFVPLAAATGVKFEEATAAIAHMTTMGTPTAEAATQIMAAMVLIQKGGPGLNKALKEQGRSLEEFQEMMKRAPEDGGGLINTLQAIREVTEKAGITLPAATGRIEAASAILQLTGENFRGAADQLKNLNIEVDNSAAVKAFDVASQSISAKTAGMLSTIQAGFNKAFMAIGSEATTILNTVTQLSPAITAFAGMQSLFPNGFYKSLTGLPGMFGNATKSAKAFTTVLLTNPIGLAATAIVGLGTALHFLSDAFHESAKEQLDESQATENLIDSKKKLNQAQQNQAERGIELVGVYEELGKKANRTKEEEEKYQKVTRELIKIYPGVIDNTATFSENLSELQKNASLSKSELEKLTNQMKDLDKEAKSAKLKSISLEADVAKKEIEDALVDIDEGLFGNAKTGFQEILFSTSKTRKQAEEFVKEFSKGIYSAGSQTELEKARTDALNLLYADKDLSNVDKSQVDKLINKFADAQLKKIYAYKGISSKADEAAAPVVDDLLDDQDDLNDKLDDNTKKQKSLLEKAREQLQLEKQKLDNELAGKENAAEYNRIVAKRDKTSIDELLSQQRKQDTMQRQLELMRELYRISGEGEDLSIGIKAETAEKEAVKQEYIGLVNEIAVESNKALELEAKIKVDREELDKSLYELEQKEIQAQIELGIATESDAVALMEQQLDKMSKKVEAKKDELQPFEGIAGPLSPEDQAQYDSLLAQITVLQGKYIDLQQDTADKKRDIADKNLDGMQHIHDKEIEAMEERVQKERTLNDILIDSASGIMTRTADKSYNKELGKLEDMKEAEIITEEEYNQRKEKAQEEHQQRMMVIEEQARIQRIEANRQAALEELNVRQQQLQEELALAKADPNTDPARIKSLEAALSETQKGIKEKGDILKAYAGEMQAGITDIFSNLFAGDSEQVKAPFRKVMAAVASMLKAMASATVTKLILDQLQLTPGGFLALTAIPAIKGIVSAAVNAFLGPTIDKIASFATGGQVTGPTLAIVGDAKNAGSSSNTEWILRNEDFMSIFNEVFSRYHKELDTMFVRMAGEVTSAIAKQEVKIELNEDIHVDDSLMEPVKHLVNSINRLEPIFKQGMFTPVNIRKFIKDATDYNHLQSLMYRGDISMSEYNKKLKTQELKIKSYASGSPFLSQPEIAMIGDAGPNNPEVVLNSPQLQEIIEKSSNSKMMSEKLDNVVKAIDSLSGRFYVLERDVAEATNRHNNKQERRIRGQ